MIIVYYFIIKNSNRNQKRLRLHFLKTNPNFNTNAPPFEVMGCKFILGGAFLGQGVQRVIPNSCANSSRYVK